MTVKFIDPTIYKYIMQADKISLQRQRDQLVNEMSQGLLIGPQYIKELQLIDERLKF